MSQKQKLVLFIRKIFAKKVSLFIDTVSIEGLCAKKGKFISFFAQEFESGYYITFYFRNFELSDFQERGYLYGSRNNVFIIPFLSDNKFSVEDLDLNDIKAAISCYLIEGKSFSFLDTVPGRRALYVTTIFK